MLVNYSVLRTFTYSILISYFAISSSQVFSSPQKLKNVVLTNSLLDSSLIVYNGNLGLIHEEKNINLEKGLQSVIYKNVASTVQTDSVNVNFSNRVKLFSQQYRFDKITTVKLLDAHINQAIKVKVENKNKQLVSIKGKLLASNGQNAIVKLKNDEIISVNANQVIFDKIPQVLITEPSLVWNIQANEAIKGKLSLDYLINKITWKSNYILNIKNDIADLTGWITIDNRSGKRFDEVKLNVLAGEINRVQNVSPRRMYKSVERVMAMSADVSHVAHEGYHFYSVPFRVTLANNEKTQIKFIDEQHIAIKRRYEAKLNHPNYLNSEVKHSVSQFVEIDSLDIPLPAGTIRSYSKVNELTLLLGENRLNHTPKHDKISLRLGNNFDIKVTENMLENNDDKYFFDRKIRYEVNNHSDLDKKIELIVPYMRSTAQGKFSVQTQQPYKWKNGNAIQFFINLKANTKVFFDASYRNKK